MKRQSNLLSFAFTQLPKRRSSRSNDPDPVIIEPAQDDNFEDSNGHLDIEQRYHSGQEMQQDSISNDNAIVTVNQESTADEVMDYVVQSSKGSQPFDFSTVNPPYDLGEIYEFTNKK